MWRGIYYNPNTSERDKLSWRSYNPRSLEIWSTWTLDVSYFWEDKALISQKYFLNLVKDQSSFFTCQEKKKYSSSILEVSLILSNRKFCLLVFYGKTYEEKDQLWSFIIKVYMNKKLGLIQFFRAHNLRILWDKKENWLNKFVNFRLYYHKFSL